MSKEGPSYGFGSGVREELKDSGAPGPGQYGAQYLIGKEGQGKTMGMRFEERVVEMGPGPGQYELKTSTGEGAKWVIGSETRTK